MTIKNAVFYAFSFGILILLGLLLLSASGSDLVLGLFADFR